MADKRIVEEIRNISLQCDELSRLAEDEYFKDNKKRLEKNIDSIERAFSGSWLGYHSSVYYVDYKVSKPGDHFDPEWGFISPTFSEESRNWIEVTYEDVHKAVMDGVDPSFEDNFNAAADKAKMGYEDALHRIKTIFNILLKTSYADAIENLNKELSEFPAPLTTSEVISHLKPAGQLWTRDSKALSQGLRTPAHVQIKARVVASGSRFKVCKKLARFATNILKYMELKEVVSMDSSDTNEGSVIIGNERSQVWKELKIFISHSEADEKIAEKLVDYLLSSLEIRDEEIRCSSVPGHMLDFGNIPELIKKDLVKNPVIIFLVTHKSLKSAWVMFELGASWIKDLTIIPVVGPNLSHQNLPGPLDKHNTIEIDEQNVESRLMDAIKQISIEKDLKAKIGGKPNERLKTFLDTFRDIYQKIGKVSNKHDEIVFKILACILKLRGINQRATATKIAHCVNSTQDIVLAHLKKLHDDQLVTFPTIEGLDTESNFQLSESAFQYLLYEPKYLEILFIPT